MPSAKADIVPTPCRCRGSADPMSSPRHRAAPFLRLAPWTPSLAVVRTERRQVILIPILAWSYDHSAQRFFEFALLLIVERGESVRPR
jgi:hypothetical protein